MGTQTSFTPGSAAAEDVRDHLAEKRRKLLEAEYQLQVMSLQLKSMRTEIKELEGFGLGSLLSRMKGDREARARELNASICELQSEYETIARSLRSLQSEIATLEKQVISSSRFPAPARKMGAAHSTSKLPRPAPNAPAAPSVPQSPPPAPATDSVPVSSSQVAMLAKAIEAGEEARKDLLQELETASTLGRCQVVQVRGVLSAIMNHARSGTADECASRVRKSIERFLRRREEAIGQNAAPIDTEEESLVAALKKIVAEFKGSWLRPDGQGTDVAGVIESLTMYLEKRHRDAKSLNS